jgi:hypothetical protein
MMLKLRFSIKRKWPRESLFFIGATFRVFSLILWFFVTIITAAKTTTVTAKTTTATARTTTAIATVLSFQIKKKT